MGMVGMGAMPLRGWGSQVESVARCMEVAKATAGVGAGGEANWPRLPWMQRGWHWNSWGP